MRFAPSALASILCVFSATSVQAAGLLESYESALLNDRALRAARYERDAGQQARLIGRSALLPSLSMSLSRSNNTGSREPGFGLPSQALDYRSSQDVLSFRQPLYNAENFARYKQGTVQSAYSEAIYSKKELELALRVTGAYFDVLLNTERLAFSDAEIAAFADQRRLAQRRYSAGEGTRTDIAESETRLGIAQANRADVVDQLSLARQALEDIVGRPVNAVMALGKTFSPTPVQPGALDEWTKMALDTNPEIGAQRRLLDAASLDVDRNRAGHYPRLDFVASLSNTDSESLNTLNQKATVRSAGIQLTVPLFAGFGVVAQTDQALSNRERAAAELEVTIQKVQLEIKRWYMAANTGITKEQAYAGAVEASLIAVEGAKRGLAAGVRTNTEVLDAQRLMFSALRDRAQARYELLISLLRLKAAAGVLTLGDVADIDRLLETAAALPAAP